MFANPKHHVRESYIGEGMVVADFGAGAGYHVMHVAEKVADYGKVYAIDTRDELLRRIKNEARQKGYKNVFIIHSDIEKEKGSGLADKSVDRVFIINTLFHVDNKQALFSEAYRILRRGGRLVVIDWSEALPHIGPHKDHIVVRAQAVSFAKQAGFSLEKDFPAGDHHYGLLFTPDNK